MNEQFTEAADSAFEEYDDEILGDALNAAVERGDDALELLNYLSKKLENIGELFSQGELFLPDMVMAGDLMDSAMVILKPALMNNKNYKPTGKKIVFGSVKGDVHDIGKNMVKMMWSASGIEVIDLGVDVAAETFLNKAEEYQPDIVALSATMTTTIPSMQDAIELFKSRGLDKKYKILVGGGSLNSDIANQLGACAYGGRDAYEALKVVQELLV